MGPDTKRAAPDGRRLLALLREDLAGHWGELTRPGFQALAVHRLSTWARGRRPSALRQVAAWFCGLLGRVVRWRFGISLDPAARLGRRLTIGHQGSIYIGADVTIGDDCTVLQGTRIGGPHPGEGPVIGDRVHIGARATISGSARIGDDARIGPNASVTGDVPSGTTALARPSRVQRRPVGR
jgi:serine O-acetyltransferase